MNIRIHRQRCLIESPAKHINVYVYVYVYIHIHIYIRTFIYIIYISPPKVNVFLFIYMYIYYIHIYTYTCEYMYLHIYRPLSPQVSCVYDILELHCRVCKDMYDATTNLESCYKRRLNYRSLFQKSPTKETIFCKRDL